MKKILASILAVLMITAALTFTVSADQVDIEEPDIAIDISKSAAAPVIDGKLDADKYQKIDIKPTQLNYNGDDVAYLQTIPLEIYISYDDANVYVFLSGDASKYYYCDHTADSAGDIWNQSCIQASFAAGAAEGADRLEVGLARNSDTGEVISNVWAQAPDGSDFEFSSSNHAVVLDGGKLNYELAVPFTTFLAAAPNTGDKIGVNLIYGYSDQGTRMFIEYSNGCAYSKDAAQFAKASLTGNVLAAAPSRGFETVDAAAEGKSLISGAQFIEGGANFGEESPAKMFDGDTETKYCAGVSEGMMPYWATWQYDQAYTVDRLILATANDNESNPGRRMADGWTLSGSNDGSSWNVIYTGKGDDVDDVNYTFFNIDLAGNSTAYQYYKISSDSPADGNVIQISEIALCGAPAGVIAMGGGGDENPHPVSTPVTSTPATGDNTLVFAILMIIAVAGVVIFKKRSLVK